MAQRSLAYVPCEWKGVYKRLVLHGMSGTRSRYKVFVQSIERSCGRRGLGLEGRLPVHHQLDQLVFLRDVRFHGEVAQPFRNCRVNAVDLRRNVAFKMAS